jgi:nucleoside-diphosphate-sugar epimerase
MKVFVTGHKGYIGTHLIELLKEEGFFVAGCDLDIFTESLWENNARPDIEYIKDFRSLTSNELKGYDVIIHLAAISNDPMGDLDKEITYEINLHGSVRLAQLAKEVGIPKFLFSGSCSIYGQGEKLELDESSALNPLSAYAYSKIEAEKEIKKLADNNFSPCFLRNATAYGYSDNFRVDLVVNNLLGCAFTKGQIRIMSDGSPWRPLIHCRDIAHAFVEFSKAPVEKIHAMSINVGANNENYQVRDVADNVKEILSSSEIVYTGEIGADPRNYKVNFDLLYKTLPGFSLQYTMKKGMEQLYNKFIDHHFSLEDFDGDRFTRLKILRKKIHIFNNYHDIPRNTT